MNDTEMLDWLEKNCDYFEHGSRSMDDGYWPQSVEDYGVDYNNRFIGMTLREYIQTRMKEELK